MATMDSWMAETFSTSQEPLHGLQLLKNHCMDCHQTCHKCSSNGLAGVLLLFVPVGNPRWPPWTLIGWDIFDFFSRTTTCTGTKLSTNGLLVVLKKGYYFLVRSELQDGHLGLWLAETFWTSFQEPLQGQSPNLPQMFLLLSCRSVVTVCFDQQSKIAAMDGDWMRHFGLLLKNHCMDCSQTCQKCFFYGPKEVLLLFIDIGNPRWLRWTLIGRDSFRLFLKNYRMDDH